MVLSIGSISLKLGKRWARGQSEPYSIALAFYLAYMPYLLIEVKLFL